MKSKQIAQEFVREAVKKYGDNILGIVLFGSAARGEESPESDIDLMIVVKGDWYIMLRKLSTISSKELLKHGRYISIKTLSKSDLQRNLSLNTGFLENVSREGVILYDQIGKHRGSLERSTLQTWSS